jgi:hypothetical protein
LKEKLLLPSNCGEKKYCSGPWPGDNSITPTYRYFDALTGGLEWTSRIQDGSKY